MKITNKFLLLFGFLLCNYTATFAQTDLENEDLKGKIKTVATTVYRTSMKEGKIKLRSISQVQESSFNKAGYMISTAYQINSLSMGEGPKRKIVYELDKDNKMLKATNYKDAVEAMSTQYVYKKGQLMEAKYQEGEALLGTEYSTYDAKGNKLSSNSTNAEGNSLQKLEFTYTKENKLASKKKSKGEVLVAYTKYEYPSKEEEKTIDLETATEEETISSYTIDTYDDNKNLLSSIEYSPDGKVKRKHLNQYNKQGNKTLKQIFDAEGNEEAYNYMRYEYLYDEKGNWTQKVEFLKNGNSLDAVQREIEYYK
jgi:hypothetical protein